VRNEKLKDAYYERRVSYIDSPIIDSVLFDVELVSNLIDKMDNGKAAGLDELSAEHLKYCHLIVICLLTKFVNLIVLTYIIHHYTSLIKLTNKLTKLFQFWSFGSDYL